MFVMSYDKCLLNLLIACVLCLTDSSLEIKELYIDLKETGSLSEESRVPECPTSKKINLLSYSYYKRTCSPACLNSVPFNLSTEAERTLYEACSFKTKCTNMTFPLSDMKNQKVNVINVNYECEDLSKNFIEICTSNEQLVKTEKHIILNTSEQNSKECNCSIDGNFSILVNDLRMQSRIGENCSLSTLQIQSRQFSCGYGEDFIFKHHIEEIMKYASIAVNLSGTSAVPRMIWLTVTPYRGSRTNIECNTAMLASSVSITTEAQDFSTYKILRPKEEVHTLIDKTIPAVSASTAIVLVGLLMVFLYCNRKRRLSTRKRNDLNSEENGDNVELRHVSTNENALVGPFINDLHKRQIEASEEEGQTENVYNCIDDELFSKTDNSETDMDYDTANSVKPISKSLTNHHRSQTSNYSYSRLPGSLQYDLDGTNYSVAKCVHQHYSEEKLCTS